ncbi:hypothetical protein ThvES_00007920 [Thiovulum sp. ES]|nr:hypothetical protein ThvES_00007920 [Thiovulum sp. ES]
MTKEELETLTTINLSEIAPSSAESIISPAPLDLDRVTITTDNKAKSVSSNTIREIAMDTLSTITYTKIKPSDPSTEDGLNKNVDTLTNNVNTVLIDFSDKIKSSVANLRTDTDKAFTDLVSSVNNRLTELRTEADTNKSNLQSSFDGLISGLNTQLAVIRTKNAEQSENTASEINRVVGLLHNNMLKVKQVADDAQSKISALDDIYKTDSEASQRIQQVNALIDTLRGTDLQALKSIDAAIDELNTMNRVYGKEVAINSSTGTYNFNMAVEGFGEFLNAYDYSIDLTVIGNPQAQVDITSKTEEGFVILARSKGVHIVPQVIDCSLEPLKVSVTIKHNKKTPMSFGVSTLSGSFMDDGIGTDNNIVGDDSKS